jgi:hypothetical protein
MEGKASTRNRCRSKFRIPRTTGEHLAKQIRTSQGLIPKRLFYHDEHQDAARTQFRLRDLVTLHFARANVCHNSTHKDAHSLIREAASGSLGGAWRIRPDFTTQSLLEVSAIRSPARPSQTGGTAPCCLPSRILVSSALSRAPSCPTRMFVPIVTAFGIVTQSQTRHLQVGGFFLDAARVDNDRSCTALERQEFNVRQGFPQIQLAGVDPEVGNSPAGPGMRGENTFTWFFTSSRRPRMPLRTRSSSTLAGRMQGNQQIAIRQSVQVYLHRRRQ